MATTTSIHPPSLSLISFCVMDPYTPRVRTGGKKKNLTLSTKEYNKVSAELLLVQGVPDKLPHKDHGYHRVCKAQPTICRRPYCRRHRRARPGVARRREAKSVSHPNPVICRISHAPPQDATRHRSRRKGRSYALHSILAWFPAPHTEIRARARRRRTPSMASRSRSRRPWF